jgi:hypothetical protein
MKGKTLTEKVQYFARKFLFLSILDPATFERQAMINKILLAVVVILCAAMWNLGTKFAALQEDIAIRKQSSNARIQQWIDRARQDSIQRVEWESLKTKELIKQLKQQDDSILGQFGKKNGR